MTYNEVLAAAKTEVGPYCKACPVCNGRACGNAMPGPGCKYPGQTAARNYDKWQEICVNMDTLCPNAEPDIRFTLFGLEFSAPIFVAISKEVSALRKRRPSRPMPLSRAYCSSSWNFSAGGNDEISASPPRFSRPHRIHHSPGWASGNAANGRYNSSCQPPLTGRAAVFASEFQVLSADPPRENMS